VARRLKDDCRKFSFCIRISVTLSKRKDVKEKKKCNERKKDLAPNRFQGLSFKNAPNIFFVLLGLIILPEFINHWNIIEPISQLVTWIRKLIR
jgi:hypothetical protein